MVDGWVTMLVLAFGIIVAAIGVFAYLRMFYKERGTHASRSMMDIPPPVNKSSGHSDTVNNNGENYSHKP